MVYYLDYSAGQLSGSTIVKAGYGGTIRYVTSPGFMQPPNPGNPKHITLAEYSSHIKAGLDVWLVYQGTTTDADGGYSLGVRNANRALQGCTDTYHPSGRLGPIGYTGPIYFTNDRTTLPSPKAWQDYLDGAASVLGFNRVGAYGFANAMDAAVGHAKWFWQAGSKKTIKSHVHFWQDNNTQVTVGGILCDRNLVLKELKPPTPPVDPPLPPIEPVEPDMQLTDIIGTDEKGRSITVGDALKASMAPSVTKQDLESLISKLEKSVRNRSTEVLQEVLSTTDRVTWGDLVDKTWGELAEKPWGKID